MDIKYIVHINYLISSIWIITLHAPLFLGLANFARLLLTAPPVLFLPLVKVVLSKLSLIKT